MALPVMATERAALILQLVPYIVGKGEVPLEEAARDFDVTADEMRTMVEKLTVLGQPGDSGYWQMDDDLFQIDWDLLDEHDVIALTNTVALERAPKLSAREAAALLAGLQLARSVPGIGDTALFDGLLRKLARGAADTPADVIVAPERVDEVRATVSEALRRGVAVSFGYHAPDAPPTRRTVDPVKVHIEGNDWYLQGWCHLRQAMRTFHLERVSEVALTDIPITHGADALPGLFEPGEYDPIVQLRFAAGAQGLVGDFLARAETVTVDGITTATVRVADAQSIKRLVARRGGLVEVVAPPAARRAAAQWAQAGLEQYR
jgi:proteasome accessory factor C